MSAGVFRLVAGASTNLTKVRETGGNFAGLYVVNTTASIIFVKLYASSASPTVGTTVPWMTFQCAASLPTHMNPTEPVCANATLWVATTANAVDSDTTAIGSGPIIHVMYE
jgi:hypothetical protein